MPTDLANRSTRLESALRSGDVGVLGELFELYHDRLHRTLDLRIVGALHSRLEVEDVLQETCVAALARIDHFRAKSTSFFLWARALALQTLVDAVRRVEAQKRSIRLEVRLHSDTAAALAHQLCWSGTSPSQVAVRAERNEQIARAIDAMSERDREVLLMRHFEELSNDEIAQILGIHKAAATNRYLRALRRLETALAELGEFEP